MFSVKQTRLFIVLSLLAAVLLSFAGLNWSGGDKGGETMHARLEIPEVDPGRASAPQPQARQEAPAPVIEVDTALIEDESGEEEEEPEDDFAGALKDTGVEIILD